MAAEIEGQIQVQVLDGPKHFVHMKKIILRKLDKYDGVGATVYILREDGKQHYKEALDENVVHVYFESVVEGYENQCELVYHEVYQNAFAAIFSQEDIYVATIVGGENITEDGRREIAHPALHLLLNATSLENCTDELGAQVDAVIDALPGNM